MIYVKNEHTCIIKVRYFCKCEEYLLNHWKCLRENKTESKPKYSTPSYKVYCYQIGAGKNW